MFVQVGQLFCLYGVHIWQKYFSAQTYCELCFTNTKCIDAPSSLSFDSHLAHCFNIMSSRLLERADEHWSHFFPLWRKLAVLFFSACSKEGKMWRCSSSRKWVIQQSGYSNFCAHVNTRHKKEIFNRETLSKMRSFDIISSLTYPCRTHSLNAWIGCVVECLQPFALVENEVFRRNYKRELIFQNTFT